MTKKIRINFTQARIRDLVANETSDQILVDMEIPELFCRVSKKGRKSFVVSKWSSARQQGTRVTLGRFPSISVIEARQRARRIIADIEAGHDVHADRRQKETAKTTLAECLDMYIASKQLKPKTIDDYRYKIGHDLAEWSDMPITKITEKMVMNKHKQLTRIGTTVANNSMVVVRAVLNYAVAISIIESNPIDIMSRARLWHGNKRRSRIIKAEQLQVWIAAVLSLKNQKAKVYFLILLYMGFRSGEVLKMEWSKIDLKGKTITVMDTKNHKDHTLPIPDELCPYIKELYYLTGHSKWLLPQTVNDGKPMVTPAKPKLTIIRVTDIEFRIHDLRRTFATIAEAAGIPLSMIKRLMNHVATTDITTSYISTETDTLRIAINRVANYIQQVITHPDG